jgi:hypothetical protein
MGKNLRKKGGRTKHEETVADNPERLSPGGEKPEFDGKEPVRPGAG